jgi:hypothetical protein
VIVAVLSGVVHNSGEQEAYGDSPLVTRHDSTTNPFWRAG